MRLLRRHPYTSIFQIKKCYDATVLDWHALRLDQFVVEVPLHDLKLPKASLRTKCTRTMVAPSGCTSFDSVNAVVKSSVSVAICFLRRGNKECTLAKLRSLTRWYTGMSQLCCFSNHDWRPDTPTTKEAHLPLKCLFFWPSTTMDLVGHDASNTSHLEYLATSFIGIK